MSGISGGRIKAVIQNILLFFITVFVGLVLTEAALRFASPPVVAGVGTTSTPKAKLYGWAPPPDTQLPQADPDTGEVFSFKTNSQGWKDVEHSFEKPEDVFRILILGDSHTYGVVPLESLFTRLVEKKLKEKGFPKVEVISMGVGAWGADQKLEALENEGIRYNPDIVIYQFCGNDIGDNLDRSIGIAGAKPFYYELDDLGNLKKFKKKVIDTNEDSWPKGLIEKSALLYNIKKAVNRYRVSVTQMDIQQRMLDAEKKVREILEERVAANKDLKFPSDLKAFAQMYMASVQVPQSPYFVYARDEQNKSVVKGWALLEAIILKMKVVSEQNNAEFIVFSEDGENGKRFWNLNWKLIHNDGDSDFLFTNGMKYFVDWKRPLKELKAVAERHGIKLIEPKREYERFEYDNHPNAKGNQSIAEDISEYLINESRLKGQAGRKI